jgi:hypothetical protein
MGNVRNVDGCGDPVVKFEDWKGKDGLGVSMYMKWYGKRKVV